MNGPWLKLQRKPLQAPQHGMGTPPHLLWIRMAQSGQNAVADYVCRGDDASEDEQVDHAEQLVGGKLVAVALRLDEGSEQIVPRLAPTLLEQPLQAIREAQLCFLERIISPAH